jgi:hypothetical protein
MYSCVDVANIRISSVIHRDLSKIMSRESSNERSYLGRVSSFNFYLLIAS